MECTILYPTSSNVSYKHLDTKHCVKVRLVAPGAAGRIIFDFYGDIDMSKLDKPYTFVDIFGNTVQVHPNHILYARKVKVVEMEKTTLVRNGKYMDECEYSSNGVKITIEKYEIGENAALIVSNNTNIKNENRPILIKEFSY